MSGALPLMWLPISDDGTNPRDLPNSIWITRHNPDGASPVIDSTAILFYVQALDHQGEPRPIGSRLGIRVVAHVSTGAHAMVRITGATRSIGLLDQVALATTSPQPGLAFSPSAFFEAELRNNLRSAVRTAAGLSDADPPRPSPEWPSTVRQTDHSLWSST